MSTAVMKQALEALEDFADSVKYDNEYDSIGRRVCCDRRSYKQHSENCKAIKAITALRTAIEEAENHIVDANKMVQEPQ